MIIDLPNHKASLEKYKLYAMNMAQFMKNAIAPQVVGVTSVWRLELGAMKIRLGVTPVRWGLDVWVYDVNSAGIEIATTRHIGLSGNNMGMFSVNDDYLRHGIDIKGTIYHMESKSS